MRFASFGDLVYIIIPVYAKMFVSGLFSRNLARIGGKKHFRRVFLISREFSHVQYTRKFSRYFNFPESITTREKRGKKPIA